MSSKNVLAHIIYSSKAEIEIYRNLSETAQSVNNKQIT
jgi:hypothetical protein